MVLEVAILDVLPGMQKAFEADFKIAERTISNVPGYIKHDLKSCLEKPNRYLLLVEWKDLESHTIGFRLSEGYQEWKNLLHHYYDPFPTVEHYV